MDGSPPSSATGRGGAAVGRMAELGAIESGAILCLRLWFENPASHARRSFEDDFGAFGGALALGNIGAICRLCDEHGRRPLMRHALSCDCVGGDEACLARMVEAALAGERDEAMMMASLMARADVAPQMVALAEVAGAALARLAVTPARQTARPALPRTSLH